MLLAQANEAAGYLVEGLKFVYGQDEIQYLSTPRSHAENAAKALDQILNTYTNRLLGGLTKSVFNSSAQSIALSYILQSKPSLTLGIRPHGNLRSNPNPTLVYRLSVPGKKYGQVLKVGVTSDPIEPNQEFPRRVRTQVRQLEKQGISVSPKLLFNGVPFPDRATALNVEKRLVRVFRNLSPRTLPRLLRPKV